MYLLMLKYFLAMLVCFDVRWIGLLCFALALGKGIETGVYLMISNYNMYCCTRLTVVYHRVHHRMVLVFTAT